MVAETHEQSQAMGVWFMLFISAECEEFPMEPETSVSDLLRTGTEPADQAKAAIGARKTKGIGSARGGEHDVVDGFYVALTERGRIF